MLSSILLASYIAIGLLYWHKQMGELNKAQTELENGKEVREEEVEVLDSVGKLVGVLGYKRFLLISYTGMALFWLPIKIIGVIKGMKK